MKMRSIPLVAVVLVFLVSLGEAQVPDFAPRKTDPSRLKTLRTFASKDRIVGTYYFYWYDHPTEHFTAAEGKDILANHFIAPEKVSYNDPAWHKKEFRDMAEAGIDAAFAVYWGLYGDYFHPSTHFSIRGLGPMQKALRELEAEGVRAPRLGLFYDTSTIQIAGSLITPASPRMDLTTPVGREVFYRTIRDFYLQVDPKYWACIDGRPIVILYASSFASNHDQATFDHAMARFAEDFGGIKPYIIKETSWGKAGADSEYAWGAALNGPQLLKTAAIGPGYDDTPVPARTTPIRDREGGLFYEKSWIAALNSGLPIVLLETWNEMHEGTAICESKEFGRQYIDLTKKYAAMYKAGQSATDTIVLKNPQPLPRPPEAKGQEFKGAASLSSTLGPQGQSKGLWLVDVEDGRYAPSNEGARSCVRSAEAVVAYLYFDAADPWFFDGNASLSVTVEYMDAGEFAFGVQYDSTNEHATQFGAYTVAAPMVKLSNSGAWLTAKFDLPAARFASRQNGRADFRLFIENGPLYVSKVEVRKQ